MARKGCVEEGSYGGYAHRASDRSLGHGQALALGLIGCGLFMACATHAAVTGLFLILTAQILFLVCAGWRVLLALTSLRTFPPSAPAAPPVLPRYTILAALLDEAEVVPQLVERLAEIDYPPDQLEGFLILEAHDHETLDAALACARPDWLQILVAPTAGPRTKPRALNHGLEAATGRLLTVYDAEDDPDPRQLREAAARFDADADGRLWALQSPLRIRRPDKSDSPFLDRQFAVEYASLFEVTMPAMARLGLPFPLGGTSNHFRVDALRAVGGWDAHNVTEDADLGFRLWRAGGALGVLSRPTYEPPPGELHDWLPQRTRWLKGFMQTWGVHTRDPRGLGWRGGLALTMTLGLSLASAAVHAGSLAWVAAGIAVASAAGMTPDPPLFSLSVLLTGAAAAWLTGFIGAPRAGVTYTAADMVAAPAYWSLLTLAFVHALWRLISEPHAWDKTRHRPDPKPQVKPHPIALDTGREVAARHMA